MAMAWIWTGMVILSVIFGFRNGTMDAVGNAAMEGAAAAVDLCLSMAGIMCLWSGIMSLMKAGGLTGLLSKAFRPVLSRLLPRAARDKDTLTAITGNVSCNLLGLGNAATPLGIQAARRMAENCGGIASNELCTLVILNTASIQLLPTTVAGIRATLGSVRPFDILPAVWIASILSVSAGLIAGRIFSRLWRK